MRTILFILLLIYVLGNVYVTRQIFRDPLLSNKEIWARLLIMWLMPIVGFLFLWYANRDFGPSRTTERTAEDYPNYDTSQQFDLSRFSSSDSGSDAGSDSGDGSE